MPQICCFYIHTYSTYKHIFTSIEQLWNIWLKQASQRLVWVFVAVLGHLLIEMLWVASWTCALFCWCCRVAGVCTFGSQLLPLCLKTTQNPRKRSNSVQFKWLVKPGLMCSSSNRGLACDWLSIGTCWWLKALKAAFLSVWKAGSYFSLDLIIRKI